MCVISPYGGLEMYASACASAARDMPQQLEAGCLGCVVIDFCYTCAQHSANTSQESDPPRWFTTIRAAAWCALLPDAQIILLRKFHAALLRQAL